MRLFAAALPSTEALDHLSGALAPLLDQDHRALLPPENWHLTLAFYGETPTGRIDAMIMEMEHIAAPLTPPLVHLSGSGWFSGSAAWIGLGGQVKEVAKLMGQLDSIGPAGSQAPKKHRPHMTIGRRSRRSDASNQALDRLVTALAVYRGPEWPLERVVLMRSDLGQGRSGRPKYTVLADARLGSEST